MNSIAGKSLLQQPFQHVLPHDGQTLRRASAVQGDAGSGPGEIAQHHAVHRVAVREHLFEQPQFLEERQRLRVQRQSVAV